MNNENKFNVECAFGDGPDDLVESKGLKILLLEHPNGKSFN